MDILTYMYICTFIYIFENTGSDAKRQAALERASSSAMGSRGGSAAVPDEDGDTNAFTAADFGFVDAENNNTEAGNADKRFLPQPADPMDHIGMYIYDIRI